MRAGRRALRRLPSQRANTREKGKSKRMMRRKAWMTLVSLRERLTRVFQWM